MHLATILEDAGSHDSFASFSQSWDAELSGRIHRYLQSYHVLCDRDALLDWSLGSNFPEPPWLPGRPDPLASIRGEFGRLREATLVSCMLLFNACKHTHGSGLWADVVAVLLKTAQLVDFVWEEEVDGKGQPAPAENNDGRCPAASGRDRLGEAAEHRVRIAQKCLQILLLVADAIREVKLQLQLLRRAISL